MLSLISYNIMMDPPHFVERHVNLCKLLLSLTVDVICLQEVRMDVLPLLLEQLSVKYTPVNSSLQPTDRMYGEIILTRNSISQIAYSCHPLQSKQGRALQHAIVEKDNVRYNVITFHLESMNCQKIRRGQMKELWELTKNMKNVIACGDTNLTAKETTHKDFNIPDNFIDVWEELKTPDEFTYYSGRFWDGDRKQRYDRVWISADLFPSSFGVVGHKPFNVWISDHDGLYFTCSPVLTIKNELGKGGFAQVYNGFYKGEQVAIKVCKVDPPKIPNYLSLKKLYDREMNARLVNHPNIIKIYASKCTTDRFWIAMEYLQGKDLSNCYTTYNYEQLVKIFQEVASAIDYLHANKIAHRDIKPQNIVMDNNRPVLIDFGLAYTEGEIKVCGSPQYIAPELYRNKNCDLYAVDVYALGVSMFIAFNKTRPFNIAKLDYRKSTDLSLIIKRKQNTSKSATGTGVDKLIDRMLSFHVNIRPSAKDVYQRLTKGFTFLTKSS